MNKEQTHRAINKLIKIYEKRVNQCSSEWDNLNESDEQAPEHLAIIGESMNNLLNEIDLMEEFMDDLKSLLEDED